MGGSLNGHSSGALATYALIGYCVATAVSATWVSFSFGGISGTAITFVTFLLAQVVYLVKARRDLQAVSMFVRREWKAVVVLNILTLSSWLFMFMALQRTEASVESAVYQGTVAIVGFTLAMVLARERFRGVTYAGLISAVLCLALLVLARLDESRVAPLQDHQVGTGLALAFIAGATGGCYIYYSSSVHRRTSVTPTFILCTRFVLLLVVTGALSFRGVLGLAAARPSDIGLLIVLSITFVILPTFLLQFSISRLRPVRVSVLTPLVPVIALGSEYATHPWGNALIPILVLVASISLIFTNVTLHRESGKPAVESAGDSRKEREDAAAP
jgi:drug/metabolite transporter (DMT)-like permease